MGLGSGSSGGYENNGARFPKGLRVFFIRGICILVVWKVIYLLWLKPVHIPDTQLTYLTARITTWVFHLLSPAMLPMLQPHNWDMQISGLINGTRTNIISIADACNALELMVLHAGFILSVPLPFSKQWPYIITGLLLILVANVLRCLALIYVYISFPNFFPFAHHYLFTLTIYLIVFLIWKRFTNIWIRYEAK